MFSPLAHWFLSLFATLNYSTIIVLMAVESSLVPFPSEVVMPPAGYLASQGRLNLFFVIAAGTLGSLIGALFNYFLALTLGRKLLYALAESRWGKLLLLNRKKLDHSEAYFNRYGRSATLIGRLVPAIRQLISLPAGLAKMPLLDFITFTVIGSTLWMTILTLLGYAFGANQAKLKNYYQEISWLMLFIFILLIIYFVIKNKKRRTHDKNKEEL